ncbi:AfsR/SARP family transcriptional regulator [Asanoa iriomotensis]|uniref:DNA-binding SARP family transcriptional activator n=1 Tax=Asanoa iriomotensis TaxID=234613 RepID=A0ABQ4BXD1_9ACTN|nr:BTAD domain-containing putative transcriptional regulator [Asanoa iriomotensis]GIF55187.1 hypothetical protein Air01nite_12820 [Asanoa iriomotensis]
MVDDSRAALGSAKRRAVLAGLALDANRPVSLRRLAEMAWAGPPPPSAVPNLRTHVAALRQFMGDRVVAHPGGYELRLGADELDTTEFLRLVGVGRAAVAAGDNHAAVSPLTAALALWRGAAGDGLPRGTTLDAHWTGLDELRVHVVEDLTEARLAEGEDEDLVGGLRRHLAANPLRERAWGQLMRALYRGGHAPAALATYREARDVLTEQLGIEPGAELARLHQAMLARAPELARGAPAGRRAGAVRSRRAVPRELPANPTTFVGRADELDRVVDAARTAHPAAVVVTGGPGAGKTALAVRAAHLLEADFPDGQIYIDAGYREEKPDGLIARALRALGVPADDVPARFDEKAGAFRSLVADRRLLTVVDGVTEAAQVRQLLPATAGPALIVVSQRGLGSLEGARRVVLGPLSTAEAGALVTAAGRIGVDPSVPHELARACGGSPLALRIAAARLAERPALSIGAVVAILGDQRQRLDWLVYEDLSVRDRLATAYATLRHDHQAARAFAVLGESERPTPTPAHRLAARLSMPTMHAVRALDTLVDGHLAVLCGPSAYVLPDLVHDYARELSALGPSSRQPRLVSTAPTPTRRERVA